MNDLRQRKFRIIKLFALFLALSILAAYSSTKPDGLERVLQVFALNITPNTDDSALFVDYAIFPGLSEIQNKFLSALFGICIITVLVYFLYKISIRLSKRDRADNAT